MDVRCEQCGTIYEFEDDRVSASGITVKCTSCGFIFKVFPKQPEPHHGAETETPPKAPDAAKSPAGDASSAAVDGATKDSDKRWLIRKPSGEIFRFRELTTLQQWIVEQKVSREDEISRTGKIWERLGAIKELDPFFDVVDKARAAEQADPREPAPKVPSPAEVSAAMSTARAAAQEAGVQDPLASREPLAKPAPEPAVAQDAPRPEAAAAAPTAEPPPSEEPGGVPEAPVQEASEPYTMGADVPESRQEPALAPEDLQGAGSTTGRHAAWERGPRRERDDPTDLVDLADQQVLRKSRRGRRLALVAMLGILAGLGGFALWAKWDQLQRLVSGEKNPTQGAYYKGRTLFRLDHEAAFRRALEQLERLHRRPADEVSSRLRANARATQAEILAAWAQYLKDDAQELETEAKHAEAADRRAPEPPREPAALRARARRLRAAAKKKADRALAYAREAHDRMANLKTKRALAEASRVAGAPPAEVRKLLAAARALGENDPELQYTFAMLAYDRKDDPTAQKRLRRAIELSNRRTGKPFFRAQLRLARVYLRRGRRAEAATVLRSITSRNPAHQRAQRLLDRLQAEKKAVAVRAPAADAGTAGETDGGAPATADAGASPADRQRARPRPADPEVADGSYDDLVRRAERYSYSGNQAKARRLYQKALDKRPGGVEALTGLGYASLDQRRMSAAVRYFRKALAVSGAYGEALIGLAEAYQRGGQGRLALTYYERYLKHHPSGRRSVLAKQNIQQLRDQLGDKPAMAPARPMEPSSPRVREPPPRREPAMAPARPMEPSSPRIREPPPRRPAEGTMDAPRPARRAMSRPTLPVREPPPARQ
jgi:predicted Zn finger-like uncharacterized protein